MSHEYTEVSTFQFIKQGWWYLTSSYALNTVLLWFVIWYFFWSIIWWLYQPFLDVNGLSIQQIWRFFAGASFISMLWSYITKYLYKRPWIEYRLTVTYLVLISLTFVAFILFESWWILTGVVLVQLAFGMQSPIKNNAINQHIPSSHRATANSIFSLLDSSWWFIGWSVCGYLLTQLWFDGVWSVMLVWNIILTWYIFSRKKNTLSMRR